MNPFDRKGLTPFRYNAIANRDVFDTAFTIGSENPRAIRPIMKMRRPFQATVPKRPNDISIRRMAVRVDGISFPPSVASKTFTLPPVVLMLQTPRTAAAPRRAQASKAICMPRLRKACTTNVISGL